jgi:hypothetical protein
MAKARKITFSKEYVLEIAITELRKKHAIPEDFVTNIKDYGDDFLSFSEVEVKQVEEETL